MRARSFVWVLDEITAIPESGIPEDLMARAQAIAVIPHVVKGAFGIGGRWGKGLVSHRAENGRWSPPSFIDMRGGSFGLQLGVQATDLVLVFTNNDGIRPLLDGKVTLGADAAAVAGPVGRHAQVATDVLLSSGVFSYSRSKGLFAGIALDGSAITIDDSGNRKAYGRDTSAEQILLRGGAKVSNVVAPFIRSLERHAPAGRRCYRLDSVI